MPPRCILSPVPVVVAALAATLASLLWLPRAGDAAAPNTLAASTTFATPAASTATSAPSKHILLFTRTTGFRHGSIPAGIACFRRIAEANNLQLTHTEDPAIFTDESLANFGVVVFLNTTGDILNDAQQGAMERHHRAGAGFMGVHSAADTEYDWPWYGQLISAYFRSHPAIQEASIDVLDTTHPSTRHLPHRWTRRDEWYDFRTQPAPGVQRLLNLDESTYSGGVMGAQHPIAWCHTFDGGRSFYTAGGHTSESYEEPDFFRHLTGGLLWAMNLENGPERQAAPE